MRKLYPAGIITSLAVCTCKFLLTFLTAFALFGSRATAQTTLTTNVSAITYLTSDSAAVVFGVRNTNAVPITITELANYVPAGYSGNFELWYHPTAVTGAPSAMTAANGWIQVPVSGSITNAPADGIRTLLSGFALTIPANTTYRLAFYVGATPTNTGPYYGSANSSGNLFVANGVELYAQGNPLSPTYVSGNTPRTFYGSITFNFTNTCTDPPVLGGLTATTAFTCPGTNFSISLNNSTNGTGQTYQWESSTDNATWSPIAGATSATFSGTQTQSSYYRVKVTCGTATVNSSSVQILHSTQLSGTYTINPALPASSTNFTTFADATNALRCGVSGPVVFNVAQTTFTEQVSIPTIPGASATKTVKFRGNLATISFTTSTTTSTTTSRAGITLDGADHVTIDSFNIVANAAGLYGWGIHLTNGADFNKITNSTIDISAITSTTQSNSAGIVASGSISSVTTDGNANNNTISRNTIIGAYQGIYIRGTATGTNAVNNIISNNVVQDFYADGIVLLHNNGSQVKDNNIHRTNRVGVTTFTGIELAAGNRNVSVSGNRIHDTHNNATTQSGGAYGIFANGSDAPAGSENKVFNNLVYNFNSTTGLQYGLYNSSSDSIHFFHNTIVLDATGSTAGNTRGFYQTTTASGIRIQNNIFYITRAGTGGKHALYFNTAASSIVSNNNVLYVNATGSPQGIGSIGTTNFATLADWRTANGGNYDAASVSADPLFVADYKPTASNVNDIGVNVGVATDILGIVRSTTAPDPGVYEFSLGGCGNPPLAGTAIASAPSVCSGTNITLDLSGNSTGSGQTYQWQKSEDGTTWVNVGAPLTAPQYTTTQNDTAWYRAVVTCSGGTPVNSTAVQVNTPATVSGVYTINNGAPTGNSNFNNFNDAVNFIRCGISGPVVFNVVVGTAYNEQVIIPAIPGASATNTIRFNGNGTTLSFGSTNANQRSVIMLDGADYIIIDSLNIDASSGTYGWGIHLTNDADNNTITKSRIIVSNTNTTSVAHAAIVMSGSVTSATSAGNNGDNNSFTNNTLIGGYYTVVMYGNTTAAPSLNNVLSNNIIQDSYGYAVYVAYQSGASISKNDISRPVRATSTTTAGVYLTTGVINSTIEKNRIHNMFDVMQTSTSTLYGVYISADGAAGSENKIINNAVYNIASDGIQYGIYNTSAPYVHIYHNTIVFDHTAATLAAAYGLYQTGNVPGIVFKNNIVYITKGGAGVKYGVYKATAATPLVSDHNVFYVNSAGAGAQGVGFQTTGQVTLQDWQTASGQDANSLVADPQFVSAATGNLFPNNGSIDSKGTGVGVATDILENPRNSSAPEPGAWEIPPSVGLDLGVKSLKTPLQQVCFGGGQQVAVMIRNYSVSRHVLSVNPVTISVNISGAVTTALPPVTVNTGSIEAGDSLLVVITPNFQFTADGNYVFNASSSVTGDVNLNNDAMPATTLVKLPLESGTVLSTRNNICAPGEAITLSLNGNTGTSAYQWQTAPAANGPWTNIGTNSATHTTAPITQTSFFRAIAICGTASDTSAVKMVDYNDPQVLSTTPATGCGTGPVVLAATVNAGSTAYWYSAATGGTLLGTGNTFTTPSISTPTTYYVAAQTGSGVNTVGAQNPTIGTITSTNLTNHFVNFEVLSPLTLESVDVYFNATVGSNFTIIVRNAAAPNAVVATYSGTTTVTGNSTAQVVPLQMTLNPGTYQMGYSVNPTTYRNTTGAVYPYSIPGVLNITGNTFDVDYWYYFYRWVVSDGCKGPRVAVTANVTPGTEITTQPAAATVCSNSPVTFTVAATGTGTLSYQWKKNGSDIAGATSASFTIANATASDAGAYTVSVTGCNSVLSAAANLTVNAAPAITTQPQTQMVCSGANAQFSVVASGTGTITYQWRKAGINIAGATSATLVINNVTAADAGSYDVVVSDGCGNVTSAAASLTLSFPPLITIQPASQALCAGTAATFTVSAGGAGNTFQWRKDGVVIAGATNASYTISAVATTDAATYDVVITNACGSVTSAGAALTINAGTNINTQPVAVTGCAGTAANFTVAATGSGTITYQWRKNGTAITGATSNNYSIASITVADAANYDVVVTGGCGPVTSSAVALTVNPATAISQQPATATAACPGNPVTFTVTASGTGTLTYQWRKAGVNIAGATAAAYTITSVAAADAGNYDVVVTGGCGNVTSAAAALIVGMNVSITNQPSAQTICAGATATFSVTATPTTGTTYQWRKNGVNITGATAATYSIVNTATTDAGNYDVVVTNPCSSVTSVSVPLVVNTGGSCPTALPALNADITVVKLLPNVINNGHTVLQVQTRRTLAIEWIITDGAGRVVQKFRQQTVAGRNTMNLSVAQLAAGTYYVSGVTKDGRTNVIRFIKM